MAVTHISTKDGIIRAITGDSGFRILAINASDTARSAVAGQRLSNSDQITTLAELLAGAILMREAMAPDQRLQMVLRNKLGGSFTVDSHADGMTRGMAQFPIEVPVEFGEHTLLKVIREMPNQQLLQGVVETVKGGGVSSALTNYLLSSEQLYSVVEVGCVVTDGRIDYAGGYLVQMLPDAHIDELKVVTEILENLPEIHEFLSITQSDPMIMIGALFGKMSHRVLAEAQVYFGCNCSQERILSALMTLSRSELNELIADDEAVTVDCDYCSKHYELTRDLITQISVTND